VKPILHRDYETRSCVDLKKVGAHVYSRHPSTSVIVAVFIVEREGGKLDKPIIWYPGQEVPECVQTAWFDGWIVAGHNAAFEQCIDEGVLGPRHGFPIFPTEQCDCTLARAAVQAIPQGLEGACKALGLKYQKDAEGHRLMLRMCKPRKITKREIKAGTPADAILWHETPAQIERLTQYCVADVYAEIGLGHALRPLSDTERKIWLLDQRMNNRGVQIDRDFVVAAKKVAEDTLERLNASMKEVTGGLVEKATEIESIKDLCRMYGVPLKVSIKERRNGEEYESEAADKEAILDLLDGDLPDVVRRALELRLEAGKASVKKFERFVAYSDVDGRARGNIQYHAASPGRWAGRGIQLQNLVRAGLTKAEGSFEDVRRDILELGSEGVELIYGPVLDLLSRMLRGCVIAAPGKRLYYGDYSNVEARGCAWASGQTDMVELFANGGKIYEATGAAIFGKTVEEVIEGHLSGENPLWRFIGKETVLGCGYGMGVDAFIRNVKKKSRKVLERTVAEKGIFGWREANWRNVEYWRELENAAKAAITDPGNVYTAGYVSFRKKGNWLQCKLPSGRILWYRRPTIEPKTEDLENVDTASDVPEYRWAIHYWTVHPMTKQWCKVSTWGGKLLQNIIEGICRDFLAGAMLRLDDAGYDVILSIHDEVMSETPFDFGSKDEFKSLMTVVPQWAPGFPLKAEVGSGTRYAK
jgi:DNA polymerase